MSKYTSEHSDFIREQWDTGKYNKTQLRDIFMGHFQDSFPGLEESSVYRLIVRTVGCKSTNLEWSERIKRQWNNGDNTYKDRTHFRRAFELHFSTGKSDIALKNIINRVIGTTNNPIPSGVLEEFSERKGIDGYTANIMWVGEVGEDGDKISVMYKRDDIDHTENIREIISEICEGYEFEPYTPSPLTGDANEKMIKVTLSDIHIGLDPSENSLFQYEYNGEIFMDKVDEVFESILKEYNANGRFDLLVIQDLGDGVDGWDGFTTRGGHKLPQNLSNKDSAKYFIRGKMKLIENCIRSGIADKIKIINVNNDNHGGGFSEVCNHFLEEMLNIVYNDNAIEMINMNRFMEHYSYGDHTFIVTHGKDKVHMKRPMPVVLDDKAINFVNDYIEHYSISNRYIHLEKGDQHRLGYQTSNRFTYRNYMAFAPASLRQQHNFGAAMAGYAISIVDKHSSKIAHSDYFLDYKKIRI